MVTNLTAEALVDMSLLSDPRVSPNGAMVSVTAAPASKRDEHPTSAIWLVSSNGSQTERQITIGTARDHHARWSPDGEAIAFLSDRKERGKAQVLLLRLDGGEAQPLTEERGGVSSFAWLPGDGQRIAYLAIDARDEAEEKRRTDERDDANVYGAFWPYARVVILDLGSGESRWIDTGERHVASMTPSPDGARLALTLWSTPEIDHVMASSQLATLNIDTGNLRLIGDPGFNAESITWSADGRSLYFFGRGGGTAVSSYQLWTVDLDLDTGHICLTRDLPACVYGLTRAHEAETILALVAEGTESAIYELNPADNSFTRRQQFPGDLSGISVSDDGEIVASVGDTADRAGNVYTGTLSEGLTRRTGFNPWLDDVSLGKQEIVTWERAGFTLDGILIWPPDTSTHGGPLPTIVSIHGGPYGRWANEFVTTFGRWLSAQGYLVFLPNPRGGMGHGQAFAEAVLYTVGNEDYRDIMAGVDMLVEQGIADADRLGCGGWSQGGFMTAWIAGQTDRFKAGVMGAGVSDWGMMIATSDIPTYETLMGGGNPFESAGPHSFDKQSPISYVKNATTPTLIVHGENDERVPVSQAIFFHRGLRRYGVPTELVTYPREPHGIQERNHQLDLLRRIADWYSRWIPVE